MARFAFISRHAPIPSQVEMAKNCLSHPECYGDGIELVHVGDADAFSVSSSWVNALDQGPFIGVVVVHPAAALSLAPHFIIGVFENASRPAVDGKPQFEAKKLHLFDLRD